MADYRPAPNPVHSFWNAESRPLDDHRTTPDLPSEADIVIIGSGFSGVATAYYLFKDNPKPPSIVLLEARKICSGATGRNGGHLKPDGYYNVPKYDEMFGAGAGAEVAAFETANLYAVKNLVESEGLDCDLHLTRAVDIFMDAEHAKKSEAAYRQLVRSGTADLKDIAFIPKKDAERVSGVMEAQCAFTFTAGHVWPLKMIHQLLEKLIKKGLNVQANTTVSSISSSTNVEGKWTINTPRGDIKATKIVHATNAYAGSLLPEYAANITPVRGICSHIETPKGSHSPSMVNTNAIRFDERNFDYMIPRADGSIIVGGARQAFWADKKLWYGNVQDDELVDRAVPYFDGYMQRHFWDWEGSGAKTSKVWTGIMGYSADFVPHVGEVPDRPGHFISAGFSGHGMPQILKTSQGLAAMIRDGVPFEKTGIPRVFKTTSQRLQRQPKPLEESLRPLFEGKDRAKL